MLDNPFVVPLTLGRSGLSEVINHLLDRSDSPCSFDFLINGEILRQSLKKFITSHRISSETILQIEYIPSLHLSNDILSSESSSWVGCIDASPSDRLFAGLYDGRVDIINNQDMTKQTSFKAHEDPIRAISMLQSPSSGSFLATGSKDQSVKIWRVTDLEQIQQVGILLGHMNSVESLSCWNHHNTLLSGDWNGNLLGWDVLSIISTSNIAVAAPASQKKRKNEQLVDNAQTIKPSFIIHGHIQSISGIQSTSAGEAVYTCSWDHSLKKWDLDRKDCVLTLAASKVMTSLHISPFQVDTILTSHPDGKIRLWDSRASDGQSKGVFYSKADSVEWMSQVRWHPTREHTFASSDYSGVIRIWDDRSSNSLLSKESHDAKAMCVDWICSEKCNRVVSGGSDSNIIATDLA